MTEYYFNYEGDFPSLNKFRWGSKASFVDSPWVVAAYKAQLRANNSPPKPPLKSSKVPKLIIA